MHWWESEDIKVDSPDQQQNIFQTTDPLSAMDYVEFERLRHRKPRRGFPDNRLYVRVHNRGVERLTGVRVRAFSAPAGLTLPRLPSDFWYRWNGMTGNPFDGNPSTNDWTPIGQTSTAISVDPGIPRVVS